MGNNTISNPYIHVNSQLRRNSTLGKHRVTTNTLEKIWKNIEKHIKSLNLKKGRKKNIKQAQVRE